MSNMDKKNELGNKIIVEDSGVKRVIHSKKFAKTNSEKYRRKTTQTFDPEKIMVTQKGVTFNVYDRIQEFEPSTNFYKVLETYNCTKDEAVERMKGRFTELKEVVDMGKSYAEHLMEINKAKAEFEALPVNVKQKFGNNIINFIENGEAWINSQITEIQRQANAPMQAPTIEGVE